MKRVQQIYTIRAPLHIVWHAFVEPHTIEQWGGGPVEMSSKEGAQFSLWGGDVRGSNTKVIAYRQLEQDWFNGDEWGEPSKVVFEFEKHSDGTIVRLTQDNVPDHDAEDIDQGWRDYYLGPIKELLEQ